MFAKKITIWGIFYKRLLVLLIIISFILNTIFPSVIFAQTLLNMPQPGTMISLSQEFSPVIINGIKIDAQNPFHFDFIVNSGDTELGGQALKDEANKLIKYFLTSLTIPEKDLWVNLSPYEKNRIIPESFGLTEMGRDLLTQDYLLKQITSSLMYPEKELGQEFWDKVYEKAHEQFGKTDIPLDTFNKVWIVPNKAVVYENDKTNTAYIVESHLKVMLEEDYIASQNSDTRYEVRDTEDQKHTTYHVPRLSEAKDPREVTTDIIKQIIIPELEKEVNTGKNFANLRQITNSLILATWYKKRLKDSLIGKAYVDKNKIAGVDVDDKEIKYKIYDKYIESFKKGVYDYIKEDFDFYSQQIIPRKYFSGGYDSAMIGKVLKISYNFVKSKIAKKGKNFAMGVKFNPERRKVLISGLAAGLTLALASTGFMVFFRSDLEADLTFAGYTHDPLWASKKFGRITRSFSNQYYELLKTDPQHAQDLKETYIKFLNDFLNNEEIQQALYSINKNITQIVNDSQSNQLDAICIEKDPLDFSVNLAEDFEKFEFLNGNLFTDIGLKDKERILHDLLKLFYGPAIYLNSSNKFFVNGEIIDNNNRDFLKKKQIEIYPVDDLLKKIEGLNKIEEHKKKYLIPFQKSVDENTYQTVDDMISNALSRGEPGLFNKTELEKLKQIKNSLETTEQKRLMDDFVNKFFIVYDEIMGRRNRYLAENIKKAIKKEMERSKQRGLKRKPKIRAIIGRGHSYGIGKIFESEENVSFKPIDTTVKNKKDDNAMTANQNEIYGDTRPYTQENFKGSLVSARIKVKGEYEDIGLIIMAPPSIDVSKITKYLEAKSTWRTLSNQLSTLILDLDNQTLMGQNPNLPTSGEKKKLNYFIRIGDRTSDRHRFSIMGDLYSIKIDDKIYDRDNFEEYLGIKYIDFPNIQKITDTPKDYKLFAKMIRTSVYHQANKDASDKAMISQRRKYKKSIFVQEIKPFEKIHVIKKSELFTPALNKREVKHLVVFDIQSKKTIPIILEKTEKGNILCRRHGSSSSLNLRSKGRDLYDESGIKIAISMRNNGIMIENLGRNTLAANTYGFIEFKNNSQKAVTILDTSNNSLINYTFRKDANGQLFVRFENDEKEFFAGSKLILGDENFLQYLKILNLTNGIHIINLKYKGAIVLDFEEEARNEPAKIKFSSKKVADLEEDIPVKKSEKDNRIKTDIEAISTKAEIDSIKIESNNTDTLNTFISKRIKSTDSADLIRSYIKNVMIERTPQIPKKNGNDKPQIVSGVSLSLKSDDEGIYRFDLKNNMNISYKNPESPDQFQKILDLTAKALEVIFARTKEEQTSIKDEARNIKDILTADGYHNFYHTSAYSLIGDVSESKLVRSIRDFYLQKDENGKTHIENTVDDDLIHDIIRLIGGKYEEKMDIDFYLMQYLTINYIFETTKDVMQLKTKVLPYMINTLNSYKFSKAVNIGRQKVLVIEEKDGKIKKSWRLKEQEPIQSYYPESIKNVDKNIADSLDDFINLTKKEPAKLDSSTLYVYHKIFQENGREFRVVIRDGRVELLYTSDTYSRVAGNKQNCLQEATLGEISDEDNSIALLWYAKPRAEGAHHLPLPTSVRLNNFIDQEKVRGNIETVNITRDELTEIHFKLGLIYNWEGYLMTTDENGNLSLGGEKKVQLGMDRYDWITAIGNMVATGKLKDADIMKFFNNPQPEMPLSNNLDILDQKEILNTSVDNAMAVSRESLIGDSKSMDESQITNPKSLTPGGIDLNPTNTNLEIRGEQIKFEMPFTEDNYKDVQFDGFVPVIFDVTPINDLPMFLGVKENEQDLRKT